MTIEPPVTTLGQRPANECDPAKVASELGRGGITYTYGVPGETPDQYLANDQGLLGTSPSSMLMYESDMSDMQKALLSPGSTHSSTAAFGEGFLGGQMYEHTATRCGEVLEESRLNLEDMELSFDSPKRSANPQSIKTEPPWSPGVSLDTGQSGGEFKYENVMMNKRGSHGPTLAQLNNTSVLDNTTSVLDEISMLDDINSIISNDLQGQPSLSTLKIEPTSPPPVPVSNQAEGKLEVTHTAVKPAPECLPVQPPPPPQQPASQPAPQPSFPVAIVNNPVQLPVSVKQETQHAAIAVPMPLVQTGPSLVLQTVPVVKAKPQATADWSYPGELSTVDKPSLLKLLAPEPGVEKQAPIDMRTMTRRPIHVPKRTRGLSEGSGLVHLQQEAEMRGLKRSGSSESNLSGSSSNSFVQKWEEIKKYLEDGSATVPQTLVTPPKKIKTESQGELPSVEEREEEGYDSATDSDLDFSDTESIGSQSSFVEELLVGGKKEKRFFWQYNTQAKGPKGKRLCKNVDTRDPHVLNTFEDPVFDPDMNEAQYRHTGRARKGDGNDVTPSPWKLFQIGNQLKRLNRKIHDIAPPSELPAGIRTDTRREKNKYASRACRLKKKAQHEANKIKLYGLDTEHAELMRVLNETKRHILRTAASDTPTAGGQTYSAALDTLIKGNLTVMIAGNTADYVNSVLEKVAQGDKTGGLDLRKH